MKYWPYEEVEIMPTEKPHQFLVKTPWVHATFETTTVDREKVEQALQAFQRREDILVHATVISDIFAQLADFPVSYILARSQGWVAPIEVKGSDFLLDLTSKVASLSKMESLFSRPDVFKTLRLRALSESAWSWDDEGLLGLSNLGKAKGFDPVTAISVLRRFYNIDIEQKDVTPDLWSMVRNEKNSAKGKQTCALLLKQSIYELEQLENFETQLGPFSIYSSSIVDFFKVEKSRITMLREVLSSLSSEEPVEVMPSTIAFIEIFKWIVKHHFVAFSMALEMLERHWRSRRSFLQSFFSTIESEIKFFGSSAHQPFQALAVEAAGLLGPVNKNLLLESVHLCELMSWLIMQIPLDLMTANRC